MSVAYTSGSVHGPDATMNRLTHFAGCAALALSATLASAQSEIYKCLDENGRPQYTNVKSETKQKNGCSLVTRTVSTVPAGAGMPTSSAAPSSAPRASAAQATPANFPRVDPNTQKARDGGRRKILEDELATEEKSLADAKAKLSEQEQVRNGDEKNYQKVLDRLQPFQEAVDRHERNVSALRTELAKLK
jgi:hypothetical protein